MGILNSNQRKALPAEKFALPAQRKYPVENPSHAANAKARATQMVKKGKISAATKQKIDAAANRELGE